MDISTILDVVKVLAYIFLGGAVIYFRVNDKLKSAVTDLIAEAENTYKDTFKSGGQKHEYVVEKLYSMIPAGFNLIITKDMVSTIVDNTFESIEKYAKQQLNKAVGKIVR